MQNAIQPNDLSLEAASAKAAILSKHPTALVIRFGSEATCRIYVVGGHGFLSGHCANEDRAWITAERHLVKIASSNI